MACPDCEILPKISERSGQLLLAPAVRHTAVRLRRELIAGGAESVKLIRGGVLTIGISAGRLTRTLHWLGELLSPPELAACQSCFLEPGEVFDFEMLARMAPLSVGVARAGATWLAEVMECERLHSVFQPIVHAGEPCRVLGYEALLRGSDDSGGVIGPGPLFDAARTGNMLFHLDRQARITAIEQARGYAITTPVFINFNPTSIYDPRFCLRTTIDAARRSECAPGSLVFEVVESDAVADIEHLVDILQQYRRNGFRIALDDLGAGYGSLNLLHRVHPDFVKLDRELIDGVASNPSQQSIVSHVAGIARELGIASIAEGIECAADRDWLANIGIDYLQGFLFARPAAPPPVPLDRDALDVG